MTVSFKSIIQLFEEQVNATPHHTALVYHGEHYTYQNLNESANRLARHLSKMVTGVEQVFALYLERSPQAVVALLAVLKSGYAYLPLDTNLPLSQLEFILRDSGSDFLIAASRSAQIDNLALPLDKIILDELDLVHESVENIHREILPNQLAYIMYTSGSTGMPKGVEVIHSNLPKMLLSQISSLGITADSRILQYAALYFDVSVAEMMMGLLSGSCLYLLPDKVRSNVQLVLDYIKENEISHAILPPALLSGYSARADTSLKVLGVTGDTCSKKVMDAWRTYCQVVNLYGPTETTIWSHADVYDGNNSQCIGMPLPGVFCYVLNKARQEVPPQQVGELHIGGLGIARGYRGNPDLTQEKFIDFQPQDLSLPKVRLYKTGDLVRQSICGCFHYIGRSDFQIKLNGIRLDPSEIETVLNKHPKVVQCVVALSKQEHDYLVAYIVAKDNEQLEVAVLRRYLKEYLPTHKIPSAYVFVEKLKVTPSGKIDRNRLPEPSFTKSDNTLLTVEQKAIRAILSEILTVEQAVIGLKTDFFSLGGTSLQASQVALELSQKYSVDIGLADIFKHSTIDLLAKRIMTLRGSVNPIEQVNRPQTTLSMSFAQKRVWLAHQASYQQQPQLYNVVFQLNFHGDLHKLALQKALYGMIKRHEILRTCFPDIGYQQIADSLLLSLEEHDLSMDGYASSEIDSLVADVTTSSFGDLSTLPLWRAVLIKLDVNRYRFCFVFHHIIIDGLSLPIFLNELTQLYYHYAEGKVIALPQMNLQYSDMSVWENEHLQSGAYQPSFYYWQKKLAGSTGILELPFDRERSEQPSYRGVSYISYFPASLTASLQDIAKQYEVSVFAVILTTVSILIYRYSQQEDFILGVMHGERPCSNMKNLIGFFVNVLPLRIQQDNSTLVTQLFQQVHQNLVEAYQNNVPIEYIINKIDIPKNKGVHPLIQATITLHNFVATEYQVDDVDISLSQRSFIETSSSDSAKFDLAFEFDLLKGGELSVKVDCAADLFDSEAAERFLHQWHRLCLSVVDLPMTAVSELPTLTLEQSKRRYDLWHNSRVVEKQTETLLDLFDKQLRKNPNKIAIIDDDLKLTYQQINVKANKMAHYLRQENIITLADNCIAVALERSANFIISALAVLKTGAAYLPLDPNLPSDNLSFILQDSKVTQVVTMLQYDVKFSSMSSDLSIVCLDCSKTNKIIEKQPVKAPLVLVNSTDLAYVIYTSGSTGNPKGVMVEHHSAVNLIKTIEHIDLNEESIVAHLCSVTFDVAVFEIWGSLLNGASLVVIPKQTLLEPDSFKQVLESRKITTAVLPTAIFYRLLLSNIAIFASIHSVLFIGEKLANVKLLDILHDTPNAAPKRLLNVYGPTEDTVFSTYYLIDKNEMPRVLPVGQPFIGTQVYVLDAQKTPVSEGILGELYLGGEGLARGYLNNSKLTQDKFIWNSNFQCANHRLYRTGDLARYDKKGNITFIKRIDQQVKVSGYRVELSGIESVLLQQKNVNDAAVVKKTISDNEFLIAYIVSNNKQKNADQFEFDLKQKLSSLLPNYMIPSMFVLLDSLPLNKNNKIDRTRMPEITFNYSQRHYIPSCPIEKELVKLWQQVLVYTNKVSTNENFFMVGGTSLLAMQLTALISKRFGPVSYSDLFVRPTIESQAKLIKTPREDRITPVEKITSLKREALLDEDINLKSHWLEQDYPSDPKSIFLTGVTGFLGIFLLERLLLSTDATIYCLIRADSEIHAIKRFRETLCKYQISIPLSEQRRIFWVLGDVSSERFGMTPYSYGKLSEKVQLIYHSASEVNFSKPFSALKGTNVDGVKQVLRFAINKKIKPLHYVSTASVFSFVHFFDQTSCLCEEEIDWTDAYEKALPHDLGYVQTKAVAEKLVWQAVKRGIPISIYRSGFILCHSETGIGSMEQLWTMMIKDCLKTGLFPLFPQVRGEFITVDYARDAIFTISQKAHCIGKAFHIVPNAEDNITTTDLFKLIASSLPNLDLVFLPKWREVLMKHIELKNSMALELLTQLFTDPVVDDLTLLEVYRHSPEYSVANTQSFLSGTGVSCPRLDMSLLSPYLNRLKVENRVKITQPKLSKL